VPSSLSGEHNGARVEDGNLVITLEDSSTTSYFRYQLLADQAGDWRQKPTLFASLSNLDDIQYGEPSSLTISPRGIKTTDIYKKSRYELQKLIKFQFEDKNYQEVEKLYAEYTEQYDEIFSTDVAKAILFTEATKDKPNGKNIIDSFEYLDSNSSKVNIPFNVILKVGAAYAELEEHERAFNS